MGPEVCFMTSHAVTENGRKSPLQLLASCFVLICYERWLPGENMVANKLSKADIVALS